MRSLLAYLLLSVAAYGQISIEPVTAPYLPIEATIRAAVPEGAEFSGGWTISKNALFIERGGSAFVWAPPGSHMITYRGYWVHTETVTFKDGDGQIRSIESFLGSGFIDETATFTVTGNTPAPPGPGPAPDNEKYQVVFFIRADDLDKLPEGQRRLITSLKIRKDLEERGHRIIQVIDNNQITEGVPGKWGEWVRAVMGDPLPRVAIAPRPGGGVIKDYPMPANYDELLLLLGERS